MKNFSFVILLIWALSSCQPKETMPDTLPMKVAIAYGFDKMDQVNSIGFTWNVQRDSVNSVSRTYLWNLKDKTVDFTDSDTTYSYSLMTDSLPPADKAFINDKYWAMMPFQLGWDSGYTFETEEGVSTPLKGTTSTKLTILYNSNDGYTPGDAYDLYLDENNKILEWTFRRGNGEQGATWTWENETQLGPLTFAQDHMGANGKRFIWISNLSVN
ncbi:hypothetical protein [Algoriphagus pacificus]|uniref:Uncharacterized protein n=1 Tax=Algoriphagus pacificus TaxID=2811234 RepID=A0ABS3C9X3_9BACT|nr:hypothetical protein [Algoriphagus pacificus]MBN7813908.1 hypothetical protein [Algoriphagus pacificus]